jgi:hypothetical protein
MNVAKVLQSLSLRMVKCSIPKKIIDLRGHIRTMMNLFMPVWLTCNQQRFRIIPTQTNQHSFLKTFGFSSSMFSSTYGFRKPIPANAISKKPASKTQYETAWKPVTWCIWILNGMLSKPQKRVQRNYKALNILIYFNTGPNVSATIALVVNSKDGLSTESFNSVLGILILFRLPTSPVGKVMLNTFFLNAILLVAGMAL